MPVIQKRYIGIIVLFSSFLLIPAFLAPSGSDLHSQSLLVRNFAEQFWNGDLYPHWLMNMYAGNGSPVFFYYPPFGYFVSALFYKVMPHDEFAFLPLAAGVLVATIASGLTFFVWIREEVEDVYALIGSLLYISIPWHLGCNFYNSLMYETLWVYAWLPLMLLSARFVAEGRTYGVPVYATMLCLVILSNIPCTIICGPFSVFYGAYFCDRKNINRSVLRAALAIGLGFGLSAVFLLPSMAYLNYVMIGLHWVNPNPDFFEWGNLFKFLSPSYKFSLYDLEKIYVTIFWVFHAAIILSYYAMTRGVQSRLRLFLLCSSVGVLLLNFSYIRWFWSYFFFLGVTQTPVRLYMLVALAVGALGALAGAKYKKVAIVYIVGFSTIMFQQALDAQKAVKIALSDDPDGYARYQLGIDQYQVYLGYQDLIKIYYSKNSVAELKKHMEHAQVMKGDAVLQFMQWKPRDIIFAYTAHADSVVRIHQSFFPGWQGYMQERLLETSWDHDSGQVTLKLPPGTGTVELKLTALWPEILGRLISIVCVGVLLVVLLIDIKSQKTRISDVSAGI